MGMDHLIPFVYGIKQAPGDRGGDRGGEVLETEVEKETFLLRSL